MNSFNTLISKRDQETSNSNNNEKDNQVVVQSVPQALERLKELESTHPNRQIQVLITGSLYLVGAFLEILKPEMCDFISEE